MKTTVMLLLTAAVAFAAPEVTVSADYVSRYTFRGDALAGRSIQPAVNVQLDPVYVTIWANQPTSRDESREVDFTAGTSIGALDAGVTAYTYPEGGNATYEPFVGFSHEMLWLKASAYAFRDVTLKTTTLEAKVAASATISKSVEAVLEAAFGGTRDTSYWSAGPVIRYKASERMSLSSALQWVGSRWVWRFGASASF